MHNAAFVAENVNGVYLPFEVNVVNAFIKRMVHPKTREIDWNLRGLSVTAPHKSSVIELLDWVDPEAQEIGAVNTVVIEDHELRGYNTDVHGLIEPLRERVGSLADAKVAVIGAGGASRAAVWALRKDGASVTVFARDPSIGEPLAGASLAGYDIVITATQTNPARAVQLAGARLVYDLIYNPIETQFLKDGRAVGCETLGGLPMLVAQARRQFELWTGKTPSTRLMYDSAAAALRR
jgi:shikimate dehydrogenase